MSAQNSCMLDLLSQARCVIFGWLDGLLEVLLGSTVVSNIHDSLRFMLFTFAGAY